MFEELRVTNLNRPLLPALSLSLFEDREFRIKYIDGLNPPPATIVTSEYAFIEGSRFQNSKSQSRNIVMTLGFSPSWGTGRDYTTLRRSLYPYLSPGSHVQLEFDLAGGDTVKIDGYVETHEASIFTKDPLSQISIMCPDPFFRGNEVTHNGASWTHEYHGSDPTGFVFRGTAASTIANKATITMGNEDGSASIEIDPSGDIIISMLDLITISTVPGNKYVRLTKSGGATYSILNMVNVEGDWPVVKPGVNTLSISGPAMTSVTTTYSEVIGGI